MVTGAMVVHADCGATVAAAPDGSLFDLAGEGGEGGSVEHRCRDYVAWHRTGDQVDRRDVGTMDVAHGWRPPARAGWQAVRGRSEAA